MSVLSTVTGSLPNILNILQGKWDVQYRLGKSKDVASKLLKNIGDSLALGDGAMNVLNKLNGLSSFNDMIQWKSLDFDSFIDMEEIQDTSIMNYPIEGGSFRSVNKVRKPKIIKVTLAKGGIGYGIEDSLKEVKTLLPLARYGQQKIKREGLSAKFESVKENTVNAVSKTFGISKVKIKDKNIPMEFRIVTPFDMIDKMNLIKLDYTFKKDNGRNMLVMFLTFQEIIEKESITKEKIKTPTNADKENVGRLSTQPME